MSRHTQRLLKQNISINGCKIVTFSPSIIVITYDDHGCDRTPHEVVSLSYEETVYLSALRTMMRKGQLISEGRPKIPGVQEPLPARSVYFNAFIDSWKRRERHASASNILDYTSRVRGSQ